MSSVNAWGFAYAKHQGKVSPGDSLGSGRVSQEGRSARDGRFDVKAVAARGEQQAFERAGVGIGGREGTPVYKVVNKG